jgi:hypothetical protein
MSGLSFGCLQAGPGGRDHECARTWAAAGELSPPHIALHGFDARQALRASAFVRFLTEAVVPGECG